MYKRLSIYYCFLLAVFISLTGMITSKTPTQLGFQVLFLPVTLYMGYSVLVLMRGSAQRQRATLPHENAKATLMVRVFFCILLISSVVAVVRKNFGFLQGAAFVKQGVASPQPSPSATPVATPTQSFVRVQDEYVKNRINIREQASDTSTVIGKMTFGEKYEVLSQVDGWYQIKIDASQIGYVSKTFVQTSQ